MVSKHHKLIYTSSYDRGLQHLLFIWSDIKKQFPDATLDIAYGWNVFDSIFAGNPERQEWKQNMISLMKQDGITEHGRIGKRELQELRKQCGIWSYPTNFTEINCISALENQADGVVPAAIACAALRTSVGCGVLVAGDIYDKETIEKYKEELLSLMGDEKKWKKESKKAVEFAKQFDWTNIASQWTKELLRIEPEPLVSIITPTIRKGWWNIMAHNLMNQTHTNFEWIIVDDYETDRSNIAAEYAKKYNLNIRYMRGKERKVKRTYGLVNANNTGLQAAKGELLVILQDFMLIPKDGLEQLVYVYKHNPDALIAPVDVYHASTVKEDITKEDWYNGDPMPVGELIKKNIRIGNKGLRQSTNPYDFEQNYGAVPMKIARELGGWYEFFDEGLGYDNTDFACRALLKGYKLLVDETNVAVGMDHWEALKGHKELGVGRDRNLNDPRYQFLYKMVTTGKLPLKATQELSDSIELYYDMPKEVDTNKWILANMDKIADEWIKNYKPKL